MSEGFCLVSADEGTIEMASERLEAMLGYATGELVGRPYADLDPSFAPDALGPSASSLVRSCVTKDGSALWCRISVTPYEDENLGATWLILHSDMTHERAADSALRRSESQLRAAQRIAGLGSWQRDMRTGRPEWSEECYRIFGVDPATFEPTIENFLQLVHPEDRVRFEATIKESDLTGLPYEIEYRIVRPDGIPRIVQTKAEYHVDESGRIIEKFGTAQDVTDLRRTQEVLKLQSEKLAAAYTELRAAVDIRDRFVSIMNHELRTPLTAVLGNLSTLVNHSDRLDSVVSVELLRRAEQQAKRLALLVEDLLTLSLADSDSMLLEPLPTDVARSLKTTLISTGAPSDVEVVCPSGMKVHVDPRRFVQVLSNLVSNAMRHGAPPIRIEVTQSGTWVEIAVSDRGPGLNPDFAAQAFDRFTQEESREHRGGTGLGLAIVRDLTRLMGGDAWYEERPGGGARFSLRLPFAATSRGAGALGENVVRLAD